MVSLHSGADGDCLFFSGINSVQIDGLNQTVLHYDGKWTNQSSYNVPSDSSPAPYMSTSDPGDTVSMTFRGGAAVSINGPRNWGHWTYNVVSTQS